ncbi:MAG TPA: YbhB/YbcL family Raf kinase inhibitor-like protein [Actinomycetota bacterium]
MRRLVAFTTLALIVAACGGDDGTPPGDDPAAALRVSSNAFADQSPIPVRYTCNDRNIPPDIGWEGVPARATSLALVIDDPDAPNGTFIHWTVWDIPVDAEGFTGSPPPLSGAKEGTNDAGSVGYSGPCPPPGAPHRYVFTVHALDATLGLEQGASPQEVRSAINSREIARGQLTGTYGGS